ncbi:hypothetical protein SVAN01_03998 [Stagonosporopsis vannaccii]|nr:hypothetical protein SVAN01_03998 [Stagonosporopsis vannaccii]
MPSTSSTTSVSSATAQTAHDVSRPDTQSVASANTQQNDQEREKEREAERLYEERIEEEYAKQPPFKSLPSPKMHNIRAFSEIDLALYHVNIHQSSLANAPLPGTYIAVAAS